MAAFQKSRMLLMLLAISLPGSLLAGLENSVENHEISLNYLNKEITKAVISVFCFEQSNSCQSTLEFEQDGDYQSVVTPASLRGMKFQGHFQRDLNNLSEFGAVAIKKDSRETKIPLSIDYDKLSLGDYDNPITRAVIAQLHPSLIYHASTELEQITKISDYLIGETKNSETLHLFKPERHKLSDKDFKKLVSSINAEFMTLDIGESYSMVIVFNHKKIPESIHVLDRWKLYRDPIFKTIIGYGDLVGLVYMEWTLLNTLDQSLV
ncbi:hypothetical protein [Endozoicomonas sp. SCSIO W0465]|uniref:hypothetical protein n=1 Tax=Endozoicomonas sp. SCSIO W0465 TaxID=2918516 RepID=UPI002074D306|nr:hypothetical protein [Endozoicomonas sp. SCSIO W0465]USE39463.1 hypothetical protein MJO57_15655 [Endozoicomonas sp. SCSIO W0465]